MVAILLILRPQPGADATAARARAMGMEPVVSPIFEVRAVAWDPPDAADLDAVLLTSANAARLGGEQLRRLAHLPCFAVGEATAEAAGEAGFKQVHVGGSDGPAALDGAAAAGARRLLHVTGREHMPLEHPLVEIVRRIAYGADAVPDLDARALEALTGGALALIHSPRAGRHFAQLVERSGLSKSNIALAAISAAASQAAGEGWRQVAVAERPRDDALLELAAKLCKTGASETGNG